MPTPPNSEHEKQDGHRDENQHHHHQQAGKQLAEHQFVIAQVGHQQQNQRLPVLLLRDAAGREQERKKQHQRKLHEAEDLEHQAAEPRHVAHAADLLPAEHRLTGGVHQHEQRGHVAGTDQEMAQLARRSQRLAAENRTGKQGGILGDQGQPATVTNPLAAFKGPVANQGPARSLPSPPSSSLEANSADSEKTSEIPSSLPQKLPKRNLCRDRQGQAGFTFLQAGTARCVVRQRQSASAF